MDCVHIIDDDEAIRNSLSWLMASCQLPCRTYLSAEDFLAEHEMNAVDVVVLDIRMGGMSGLELFDRFQAAGLRFPVIFLTAHGDVPMAVAAIKAGAYDFLEKPTDEAILVAMINRALDESKRRKQEETAWSLTQARLRSLSEREREIMDMIVLGKQNKVIARDLGIATRTVEVHRARIFAKMGVRTAVELATQLPFLRK